MQPWINELYVTDALRAGMYAQEPALVVAPGEFQRANTPENNLILQRRMRSDFGIARGGINRLEKLLKTDKESAVALTFDQVVGQTLADIKDPRQRQQALDWVQQQQQAERNRQTQDTMGFAAATLVAVGANIWGVSQVALIFGGIATFQGGKMSIEGINQAGTNLDALKAGDAGGKRLTAMNPHQARMDYQMAMVNVGLSLLDAKVAVSSIREVLASRRAVQALGKLKPNQVDQFAEATKLQQAGQQAEAEKTLQQLKGKIEPKAYNELEKLLGGRLEPNNPNSTSLPRNGKREVLNQMDSPIHGEVACGPTSCGMVLNTAGKPVDIGNLLKQTQISSTEGTRINKLADTLRANGIENARWLRRVSVDDLAKATKQGNPAIVHLRLDRGDHYVLVDGITVRQGQKVVAIRDPAGGRQYFTPIQEFTQSFKGDAVLTNSLK